MVKNFNYNSSPILICGMHRSGTTLLSKILSELGVFIGSDLQEEYESRFFQYSNEFIIRRLGGAWDNPNVISYLKNKKVENEYESWLRNRLTSNDRTFYWKNYQSHQTWGWKDPRNGLLVKLWMNIFPNSRIIYIYRNGVDVAKSLNFRALKQQSEFPTNNTSKPKTFKMNLYEFIFGVDRYYNYSSRCLSLDSSFQLWEEYNQLFNSYVACNTSLKMLTIKFEELLESPYRKIKLIENFLSVPQKRNKKLSVLSKISPNVAYKFMNDNKLKEYYLKVKNSKMMRLYGYDELCC